MNNRQKFYGIKTIELEDFRLNLDFGSYFVSREELITIIKTIRACLDYLNVKNTEIGFSFVAPSKIRAINGEFRSIDKETDVLSFPIDDDLYGDIVISRKRCYKQAKLYGNSHLRELSYLICHSMLHLAGYDHLNYKDKKIMRSHEKEIMSSL
ncbi:MAG: rRNA maturation RNase YbeY [Ezakiella sp.]|nr:rRNA maturation RNase YbeY [Ezakiella sp.]